MKTLHPDQGIDKMKVMELPGTSSYIAECCNLVVEDITFKLEKNLTDLWDFVTLSQSTKSKKNSVSGYMTKLYDFYMFATIPSSNRKVALEKEFTSMIEQGRNFEYILSSLHSQKRNMSMWFMDIQDVKSEVFSLKKMNVYSTDQILQQEETINFLSHVNSGSKSINPEADDDILTIQDSTFYSSNEIFKFQFDSSTLKNSSKFCDLVVMLTAFDSEKFSDYYFPAISCPCPNKEGQNLILALLSSKIERNNEQEFCQMSEEMVEHIDTKFSDMETVFLDLMQVDKDSIFGLVDSTCPDKLVVYRQVQ